MTTFHAAETWSQLYQSAREPFNKKRGGIKEVINAHWFHSLSGATYFASRSVKK